MSWFNKLKQNSLQQRNNCDVPDDNPILFQAFEWHTPSQPPPAHETHSPTSHYARLNRIIPSLPHLGVTSIWLPPGCKANDPKGNGYDCYDLWDLGEFDWKLSRSTKWGSREELLDLLQTAKRERVDCIWDAVLNHKAGGDGTEEVWAVEVDAEDRRVEVGQPKKIEAWLKFDFPARERNGMKYSSFKWRAEHFNGTDWDDRMQRNAIYKLVDDPATYPKPTQQQRSGSGPRVGMNKLVGLAGKLKGGPLPQSPGRGWHEDVDKLHGNYDFLMFSNIDYRHPAVREDVIRWAEWMVNETGIDGFRLDAAQHFSYNFSHEWVAKVHEASRQKRDGKEAFVVGEIWTWEVERITNWLDVVGQNVYAYDSPLLYNFSRISEDVRRRSKNADLRTIIRGSLVECRPQAAVTLVTNHDTQPGQTSYTPMLTELKPLFYAFILLRQEGYPCVFWGDMYGTKGSKAEPPSCMIPNGKGALRSLLPDLMLARKLFAYGKQTEYWDAMSCIAWARAGVPEKPGSGCVVVLSIGPAKDKLGKPNWTIKKIPFGRPGEVYVDILGNVGERAEVRIDEKGEGLFSCRGMSVGVFVRKDAEDVKHFPVEFDTDVYRQ